MDSPRTDPAHRRIRSIGLPQSPLKSTSAARCQVPARERQSAKLCFARAGRGRGCDVGHLTGICEKCLRCGVAGRFEAGASGIGVPKLEFGNEVGKTNWNDKGMPKYESTFPME